MPLPLCVLSSGWLKEIGYAPNLLKKDDPKPLTPQDIGPNWREAQLERIACESLLAEIEEDADHP